MKLIVLIFIICIVLSFILSCATVKPDRQEQGTLIGYERTGKNKAVLMLLLPQRYNSFKMYGGMMVDTPLPRKQVIYYQKLRGAGIARWFVGDKYTIHFKENTIIKITKNQ